MLQLITGKMGGGKTYYAVREILDHLSKGGIVYTNIELVFKYCLRYVFTNKRRFTSRTQVRKVDPNLVKDWQKTISWGKPDEEILVVIDEAHLFYGASSWQTTRKTLADFLDYLSQSRKTCVQLRFICQHPDTIDANIRRQAQWIIFCRDLSGINIGIFGKLPLQIFNCAFRDVETMETDHSIQVTAKKQVFKCYDTRAFLTNTMQELGQARPREGFQIENTKHKKKYDKAHRNRWRFGIRRLLDHRIFQRRNASHRETSNRTDSTNPSGSHSAN